jgi:hypothetical protein
LAATQIQSQPLAFSSNEYERASSLLMNKAWREKVLLEHRLNAENALTVFEQSTLDRANYLQDRLCIRLAKHVKTKLPENEDLHDHWCFHLTASKLGHMAALMVMFQHVKDDLVCLDDNQCLLSSPEGLPQRFRLARAQPEDGVYLYYDTNARKWVRGGMVAARPFVERGSEHKKGSMLTTADSKKSKFYRSYPSKAAAGASQSGIRKGYFENLKHYIALGYPVKKSVDGLVDIFGFSEADNNNINTMNPRMKGGAKPTLEDKQRRAVHYLGELAYALCLSPHDNISSNPGWEQALRYYGI